MRVSRREVVCQVTWYGVKRSANRVIRCAVDWSRESYPEDLEFEALVDVLRGRVKINIHCYEAGKCFDLSVCSWAHLHFSRFGWDCSGKSYFICSTVYC